MTIIEVYLDKSGKYRWRMKAENNRIIADGAQGYVSYRNVMRAVEALRIRFDDGATNVIVKYRPRSKRCTS